jgi:hypothetical protein
MVVHDLNLVRIIILPGKADSPLIIDTDAHSSFQAALENFKAIGRWDSQILQGAGVVYHSEFTARYILNIARQATRHFTVPDLFRFFTDETFDHSISSPGI